MFVSNITNATGTKMLWINKPAGLLSQGDRTGDVDVLALSREYVRVTTNKPGEAFVAMVHRLDRPGKTTKIYALSRLGMDYLNFCAVLCCAVQFN